MLGTVILSEARTRKADRRRQHLEFEFCSGIAQPVEQAAVNRKVQGSSPCPGANFEFDFGLSSVGAGLPYILGTSLVHPLLFGALRSLPP
jgi:hypothetical protein